MSISNPTLDTSTRPVPKWIQKELLTIGGYADDGTTPLLRFIHPEDTFVVAYGVKLPRYWESRKTVLKCYEYAAGQNLDGTPIYRYVETEAECLGPFRPVYEWKFKFQSTWKLEVWLPPEKYRAGWEAERYVWENGIPKDALGPAPETGGYTFVASMDGGGSEKLRRPKGLGTKALDYVRKIWKIMMEDEMWKGENWREAPTSEMYAKRAKEENELLKAGKAKEETKMHEIIKNELDPMQKWLFNKEKSVSFGKGDDYLNASSKPKSPLLVDATGKSYQSVSKE